MTAGAEDFQQQNSGVQVTVGISGTGGGFQKFETALSAGTLSGESRAVVERAYQSIRSGHDQVSAIKHGLEA